MSRKSGAGPLTQLADLPASLTDSKTVAREEKEISLENADRDRIDQIVLSGDVQNGGKIRVTRRGPNQQNFAYVCTIPAEQWDTERSVEYLKKEFGGGEYDCKTFRANGQMYKPFSFSIDDRIKGRLDDDQIARLANDTKAAAEATNRQLLDLVMRPREDGGMKPSDFLKMMEMQSSKSDQMMVVMMTMMTESQKANSQLLAAVLGRPTPPPLDNGMSTILPVLLEMVKGKQERTPMNELVDAMVTMKQLQNGENPKEEEPDDMLTKITKLLGNAGPVLGVLTGKMNGAPAMVQAPQPGSQPVTQPVSRQVKSPSLGPVGEQLPFTMKIGLATIVKQAEKGADPELYADLILDQFDDPAHLTMMRQVLTRPDWRFQLWGDESRTAHVAPWLEQLKQLILSYDPNSTASAEGGPSSDDIRTEQQPAGPSSDSAAS